MASNLQLSAAAKNAANDAFCALLNGGTIKLYTAPQPATADTAITTQTLLATCTFSNPAFGASSAGVATANTITGSSDANASGEAVWFRALNSSGGAELDGSCGTTNADCLLSSTSVVIHGTISITAMTVSL